MSWASPALSERKAPAECSEGSDGNRVAAASAVVQVATSASVHLLCVLQLLWFDRLSHAHTRMSELWLLLTPTLPLFPPGVGTHDYADTSLWIMNRVTLLYSWGRWSQGRRLMEREECVCEQECSFIKTEAVTQEAPLCEHLLWGTGTELTTARQHTVFLWVTYLYLMIFTDSVFTVEDVLPLF